MAEPKSKSSANDKPLPKKSLATPIRYYLVAFNVLSALGWSYLLLLTLFHLSQSSSPPIPLSTTSSTASSTLANFLARIPFLKGTPSPATLTVTLESRLPEILRPLYRRATTTYATVGTPTALVQSLAILEVLHALLKWVPSPVSTTAAQVASRLFLVWGIVEQFSEVRTNPLFTTMLLSWSITEVIRYSFYAASLLHLPSPLLTYLRYTTFYLLYPTGASSEAFLIYATLPASPPKGWRKWSPLRPSSGWGVADYFRAMLFVIWWPGLYIMYTYMIAQRRKNLGKGSKAAKGSKTN